MDNQIIKEELFCQKFELDSLAEILLKHESERMVPKFCLNLIEHDHLERYKLVSQYSKDKKVLDIACGTGYGSHYLGNKGEAFSVLGADLDSEAVRYATHRYKNDNISFTQANAEEFTLDSLFDLIVSFETIEHLPNYEKFLHNVKRQLDKDGCFIVSTPISSFDIDNHPVNKYHTQEWGFLKFQEIISNYFKIDKIYLQLYQNSFKNEVIIDEFYNRKINYKQKIRRFFKRVFLGQHEHPNLLTDWFSVNNFSKIEEYTNQYKVEDIGRKYIGYQVLVCRL